MNYILWKVSLMYFILIYPEMDGTSQDEIKIQENLCGNGHFSHCSVFFIFLYVFTLSLPSFAIQPIPLQYHWMQSHFDSPVDIRYESMINTMLKDLFELLVACVAKPTETISRVGCSCIRWEKGFLTLYSFYYEVQEN